MKRPLLTFGLVTITAAAGIALAEGSEYPITVVAPRGHGTLVKKNDLLPYRQMIKDVMTRVKTLRDQGKSLQDVLAAQPDRALRQDDAWRHATEQRSIHHRSL